MRVIHHRDDTLRKRNIKVTGYRRVGVAYVKTLAAFHYVSVSCRTFRVMHLVACMDSFIYKNYLQESARLNFTHTQREIAAHFQFSAHDLRTWVRPLQLLFWHTKHGKSSWFDRAIIIATNCSMVH